MKGIAFDIDSGVGYETNVGKSVDSEKGERGLRVLEFEVAEEEVGFGRRVWGVVGDEGGGEEGEFGAERFELELGFVVELESVEEDKERERAGGFGGEEAREEVVGEADDAGVGLGLEREQLGDDVGFIIIIIGHGRGGSEEEEEREEE